MAKGDIISRLKLESGEFDSKIKRAGQELLAYAEHCRKMSLTMGYANKDAKDFAKSLGSMATVSQTARGKINELSEAFVNANVMYKNMTDEEKRSEFGKSLASSLDQLKVRLNDAKNDLASVQSELNGSKFGQFGNVIDTIGNKLGVTGNLTEMLTSKTALLTSALGTGVAVIVKATEAWASYNAELAKQDQITTVTTGLKGDDADRMTDKMRALSDTYNVDFREAVNAANTLMTQFGKSGDEATQLIKDGMQGMIQGDGPKLLSMIQQYAPAFRDAGVSASQLVAVIQNSEGGIFTDQNMNAIVMGIKNIRLMTKATSDALAQLGIDGDKMSKQLSDGSLTVFDALKQVAVQLQTVDSNSKTAGEVMQQVFGRQGVTAGTNLAKAIETLNTNLDETKRQTGEVGESYRKLQEANEKLNKAIRDCFEYDGWDQMATGIKTNLVSAMAEVLEVSKNIKGVWSDIVEIPVFDVIISGAMSALGPLGNVYNLLRAINKEKSSGATTGVGYSDMDKVFQYVKNGTDQAAREQRYDQQLAAINRRLSQIGRERKVTNSDGTVSYKIDSQEVQQQKREALLRRRLMLINSRDSLLQGSGGVSQDFVISANPTRTGGGGRKSSATVDKEAERQAKMLAELRKEEARAAKVIADERERARKAELKSHQTETTGTSGFNEQNIANWTSMMKDQLSKADFGSVMYNQIAESMKDMSSISQLAQVAMKNGLSPQALGLTDLFEQAFDNIDVSDASLQGVIGKINQKLQEKGIKPVKLDVDTGNLTTVNEVGKETAKTMQSAASAASSLSSAMSSIQDPAVRVAGMVAQAIGSVAMAYGQALATDWTSKSNIWTFIAAAAASTASMISTIAAIHSATGYAEGGIVKGNSYSGDNIIMPVNGGSGGYAGLNAGEIILNRASQGAIASQLTNGGGGMRVVGEIQGEKIVLVANRFLKRSGQGELVTW